MDENKFRGSPVGDIRHADSESVLVDDAGLLSRICDLALQRKSLADKNPVNGRPSIGSISAKQSRVSGRWVVHQASGSLHLRIHRTLRGLTIRDLLCRVSMEPVLKLC